MSYEIIVPAPFKTIGTMKATSASACITCHNCGEVLTAPVFKGGKPYGYSCASKLFFGFQKPGQKSKFVMAESHTLTEGLDRQMVSATYQGRTFKVLVYLTSKDGSPYYKADRGSLEYDGTSIYINLLSFKK